MLFFFDPTSRFSATYQQLWADLSSTSELSALEQNQLTANTSYLFVVQLLRQLLQHRPQIVLSGFSNFDRPRPPASINSRPPVDDAELQLDSDSPRLQGKIPNTGDSNSPPRQATSLNPSNSDTVINPFAGSELDHAASFRSNPENEGQLSWWRSQILQSPSRILLETSGSTGTPQTVWHSVESLTRGVRLGTEHRGSVWGLAYPLDHLAGLQVLFQALLNVNPLIQLYRTESSAIHQAIDQHQISHLSCTPTFLRMLLAGDAQHPSVQRLTNGGERYDAELDRQIRTMFPHARRRNIYASTEVGPLLVSDSDQFRIPDHLLDLLQIIDGELWLHQSLRVDNSGEPSLSLPSPVADFFATGDQVEILADQPLTIRFLSRKTEGFNVAGFRVDPHRLESIARQHPCIANSRFYGVPNSVTEHVVACDLVLNPRSNELNPGSIELKSDSNPVSSGSENLNPRSNKRNPDLGSGEGGAIDRNQDLRDTGQSLWDESQFRTWFAERVQRHELPRLIKVVTALPTTESGKVSRRGGYSG